MSRVVMSFVCIYYIIFILLSHGFIPGLSALSQSYPATRFSWPVEYRKWHPLFKKHPCLINASFPFTISNLYQCPSLINTLGLIDAPMTISPQIPVYQQITKRSTLIKASCSMSNSNDNDPEWRLRQQRWDLKQRYGPLDNIDVSMDHLDILLFINSLVILSKNLLVLFSLLKPWK